MRIVTHCLIWLPLALGWSQVGHELITRLTVRLMDAATLLEVAKCVHGPTKQKTLLLEHQLVQLALIPDRLRHDMPETKKWRNFVKRLKYRFYQCP
jgi:hypothetical protein